MNQVMKYLHNSLKRVSRKNNEVQFSHKHHMKTIHQGGVMRCNLQPNRINQFFFLDRNFFSRFTVDISSLLFIYSL